MSYYGRRRYYYRPVCCRTYSRGRGRRRRRRFRRGRKILPFRIYKRRIYNLYRSKRLQSTRHRLALPPVRLKQFPVLSFDNQWNDTSAAESTTWNYFNLLEDVTDFNDLMDGLVRPKIYWLPQYYRIMLQQPEDTFFRYRIMIIKVFSMRDWANAANLTPANVLESATSIEDKLYATYDKQNDQHNGPIFKVLHDRLIQFRTTGDNSLIRNIQLKIPGRNVQYEEDEASSRYCKNAIVLAITTDATAASATHVFHRKTTYKWVDDYSQ